LTGGVDQSILSLFNLSEYYNSTRILAIQHAECNVSFESGRLIYPLSASKSLSTIRVAFKRENDSSLRLKGSSLEIVQFLSFLVYSPPTDHKDILFATLSLSDRLDGTFSLNLTGYVNILSLNKPPVIKLNSNATKFFATEDEGSEIFKISIEDPDSLHISLNLSVSSGSILYGDLSDQLISINGISEDISTTVNSLRYVPPKNVNALNSVEITAKITVYDGVDTSQLIVPIHVHAVNDPPNFKCSENVNVYENTPFDIGTIKCVVDDIDSDWVFLSLTVFNGTIISSGKTPCPSSIPESNTTCFSGSVKRVNKALSSVIFSPFIDYIGSTQFYFQMTDDKNYFGLINHTTLVNISPQSSVGKLEMTAYDAMSEEDVAGIQLQGLKITNLSSNSASTATVFLSAGTNLSFVVQNDKSLTTTTTTYASNLTFTGSLQEINDYLLQIYMQPQLNFNGLSEIKAFIVDKFNQFVSPVKFLFYFSPVNDPPLVKLHVPSVTCNSSVVEGCKLNILIQDPDASEKPCSHGNLFLVNVTANFSGYFEIPDKRGTLLLLNSSSGLSFKISSFVSNNKLIDIVFHPKPGIFGDALIYVSVSDEGNCGDIKKPKVVLTSNATEILTVSSQFLLPRFQLSSSNMNISYALNFSLPSVQVFDDFQGKLLSVNISLMNEESDSLLYSNNMSKGKYVTFTSKNPKEMESFISKVKYFTTDKSQQLDLILFNLSNSVYSSHGVIKVFKKLDKINPFNESMNIITLRQILNSNIFPGILSNDFVIQQEKCHLKMICLCCSFIRIGMTESLRSGVDYFYNNSIALKELKLVGFPLQIEKAKLISVIVMGIDYCNY